MEIFNFLYGSSLDVSTINMDFVLFSYSIIQRLNRRASNDIENIKWLRDHLCDDTFSESLFFINNKEDQLYFQNSICNLNDNILKRLIKNISVNIDFSEVKQKVRLFIRPIK